MANINDIDSLFTLLDQSPNDYREFYHEKNGIHALDKWSYLKNIQLENPEEEGISIFENHSKTGAEGSLVNSSVSLPDNETPIKDSSRSQRQSASPNIPSAGENFVVTPPPVSRTFNSPVVDANPRRIAARDVPPVSSKFEEPNETFIPKPLDVAQTIEPPTPKIYSPVAPTTPKVFSTTDIPTVPSYTSKQTSNANPSTTTSFSSGFMSPTLSTPPVINTPPANSAPPIITSPHATTPEPQPSILPPNLTKAPSVGNVETTTTEQASDATKNPLNTIFSRLEQK